MVNRTTSHLIRRPSAVTLILSGALVTLCVWGMARPARADEFARRNNQGNTLVEEGRLDDALQKYQEADVERPGVPELEYNKANVFHMKGDYDTAAAVYQQALASATSPVTPDAFYNLGNTLFRMGQYGPAAEAYKRTLMENPEDREAKFNLELALRRLQADSAKQENKEQNPEQKPDSSGQDQEQQQQKSEQDKQDQDSTGQQQNQDQKPKPDSSEGQSPPAKPEDSQQAGQQQQQAPQPIGMTKQDAERILDALKNKELEVQKLRAQRVPVPANAKDW